MENYKIRIKEATKLGYAEAEVGDSINYSVPKSKTRRVDSLPVFLIAA